MNISSARSPRRGIPFVPLLACLALLAACSSLHRADAPKFMRLVNVGGMQSAQWSTVLAVTHERAYVEHSELASLGASLSSGPSISVWWVPVSELSPEELERVKALAREHSEPARR